MPSLELSWFRRHLFSEYNRGKIMQIDIGCFQVLIEEDKVKISSSLKKETTAHLSAEDAQEIVIMNAQIDVVESYTLALVMSLRKHGVSLETLQKPLSEAILTVLDAIDNEP